MATTGCLLNCLREVRLERFHRNFTERGLINCEQLSSLLVEDYSRFGVTSTDDRRRLFQLIHIIKSVQADGIHCQHGKAASHLHKPRLPSESNIPAENPSRRREELPDVTRNGMVLAVDPDAGHFGAEKCPDAPSRQPIKPPTSNDLVRKLVLHVTEEPMVVARSAATATHDTSGTPKFECRKMLNFSDSDLCSDSSDSSNFWQVTASTKPLSQSQANNSIVLADNQRSLRPPQILVAASSSSPRAFVISAHRRLTIQQQQGHCNNISQTSGTDQKEIRGREWNVHLMKKSSLQNEDGCHHAYFPTAKILPEEELPSHVEQINHSSGYNYGVPRSSFSLADKVLILCFCESVSELVEFNAQSDTL